jgi:tetratricopeptide (TPR) repeat protein
MSFLYDRVARMMRRIFTTAALILELVTLLHRPASAVTPESDAEVLDRAEAALKAQDWKTAEAAYRDLVRRTPDAAKPHGRLGAALLGQGKVDAAIAEFERSVALEDSAQVRFNLGLAYGTKGNFAAAADALRAAVKLQPDYPKAWSHLVDALARNKKDMDALDAVKAARDKCPQCGPNSDFTRGLHPLVLYFHDKAARFFQEGKLDLAETGEGIVLTVDPHFADAYYNLGKIAAARGKNDKAETFYLAAIGGYRPEEKVLAADAKNNLAMLLTARGEGRPALKLVREAIAVRGERPSYLDTLGRACDAVNDRACARDAYGKLLGTGGGDLPADIVAHARERLARLGSGPP